MFQILLWYPWKGKKEYVPLRTAYSEVGRLWHPGNPIVLEKTTLSSRAGESSTSFPEEDTTMPYSGLEPTRLQAEGHIHHTDRAASEE
ncbi:hypothetical protein TNCV_1721341 [Trichonephila clavipes]|nr:hypothetical protein TNCV_1721341 [Trichonephila clavipes]